MAGFHISVSVALTSLFLFLIRLVYPSTHPEDDEACDKRYYHLYDEKIGSAFARRCCIESGRLIERG